MLVQLDETWFGGNGLDLYVGSQLEQITVRKEAASENHDTNRPDGDSVVYSPVNHRTDSIFQRLTLDQSILRDRVLFTYFLLFDSISLHDSKSFKELAAGIGVELAFESACRPGSTSFQRAFSIVKSRLYTHGSIENSFAFETSRLFGGFARTPPALKDAVASLLAPARERRCMLRSMGVFLTLKMTRMFWWKPVRASMEKASCVPNIHPIRLNPEEQVDMGYRAHMHVIPPSPGDAREELREKNGQSSQKSFGIHDEVNQEEETVRADIHRWGRLAKIAAVNHPNRQNVHENGDARHNYRRSRFLLRPEQVLSSLRRVDGPHQATVPFSLGNRAARCRHSFEIFRFNPSAATQPLRSTGAAEALGRRIRVFVDTLSPNKPDASSQNVVDRYIYNAVVKTYQTNLNIRS